MEAEFYEAFARAILTWQYVESALVKVFAAIVRSPDDRAVSAAFYSVTAWAAKVDMVSASLRTALDGSPLVSEWKNLEVSLKKMARHRNDLAHFMLVKHTDEKGNTKLMVRPSLSDSRHDLVPTREHDVNRIREVEEGFTDLSKKLHVFWARVTVRMNELHRST